MATRRPVQRAPEAAQLSERTFDETVAASQGLLLVDFWADWSGPAHTIAPVLEDLAAASEDRVTRAKVNVVENAGLATRYGIRSVATILFVKEGPVADRVFGAVPKTVLRRHLDRASLLS